MKVLEKSYNYRLILLTATPIYDNITEIFELSNLLNANNPNLQLPIRKQIEKSEYIQKDKTNSGLKGNIYQITESVKELLNKSLLGKVSYLQANTETNPKTIIMGSPLIPNTVGTTNVVFCKMSKYQYNVYKNALNSDLNVKEPIDELISETGESSITEEIHNIESEENILENEGEVSKTSSLYKNSSDASTMTYPDNTYGKGGFSKIFTKGKLSDPNVLTTDLHKYSSKLYNLLKNINNRDTGNVFIYSNYVSFGGTSLIKALLLANGFYEYSTKRTSDEREYKSFVVFDQNTKTEKREKYKRIFNSFENIYVKLIRILL
jgi:hypothetical protein